MSTALVIPTIRPELLRAFFGEWGDRGGWDRVVIVEDRPEKSGLCASWRGDSPLHYSHKEIGQALGDDAWIISRQDSACRCFGFLVAWWLGVDRVITLDDDCFPADLATLHHLSDKPYSTANAPTFAARHMEAIYDQPRWASSVPGMRIRGLPYQNHGTLRDVVANVGLWTGHPDLDAVETLRMMAGGMRPSHPLPITWIVPHGQFLPVCGMNLAIERKALPLFYFPLQGVGQPYRRFDDIWAGVIAKHCMDALGWHLSVGEPFVEHRKASDPFVNLVKEAPGIGANELFWETIASAELDPDCLDDNEPACNAMYEIGVYLQSNADPYLARLGKAVHVWQRLFRQRPRGI